MLYAYIDTFTTIRENSMQNVCIFQKKPKGCVLYKIRIPHGMLRRLTVTTVLIISPREHRRGMEYWRF